MSDKPKRTIRLVPVGGTVAKRMGVTPQALAKRTFERAAKNSGPDGFMDIESRLAASKDIEDTIVRGGKNEVRAGDSNVAVRICDFSCPWRVGGREGCSFYIDAGKNGIDLDGGSCEKDLAEIAELTHIFEKGDEDGVRTIAGKFAGSIIIQLKALLDTIVADGAVVEEPVFDSKGCAIFEDVPMLNARGEAMYHRTTGEPKFIRKMIKTKKEHPALGRVTTILKETRLINFSEWQLTPKSSGTPPATEGMILHEDNGGGKISPTDMMDSIREQTEAIAKALKDANVMREQDPAFIAMMEKSPKGLN